MELRRREYSAALSFRAPFGRIGVLSGLASLILLVASCDFGSSGCERKPDRRLAEFRDSTDAAALVGLSEEDVRARIGQPSSDRFPDWDETFWLRPQGLCMDGWYLALKYENGVVSEAAVIPG